MAVGCLWADQDATFTTKWWHSLVRVRNAREASGFGTPRHKKIGVISRYRLRGQPRYCRRSCAHNSVSDRSHV